MTVIKIDTALPRHSKVFHGFRTICLLLLILLLELMFWGCTPKYITHHPDPYKPLVFPRDHGAHRDTSQFEWWYYNGEITTESGKTYYIFVCFFRGSCENWSFMGMPVNPVLSLWPIREYFPFLFYGASIVDVENDKYIKEYKNIIPFFWIANAAENDCNYFIGSNRAWREPDDSFRVQAKIKDYKLDLILTPDKTRPYLISGPEGLGNLSPYNTLHKYYSITRLKPEGTIKKGKHIERIAAGHCWMDHEWSVFVDKDRKMRGWDWMGVNLDNGIDFHIGNVNLFGGGIHPESFITLQYPDGRRYHYEAEDYTMRAVRSWRSFWSGITYGIDWIIDVPSHDIHLVVKAHRDKQQMTIIPFRFWEGHCDVEGTVKGKPIHGRAFLETFGDSKFPLRKLVTISMEPLDYCKNSPKPKNPPPPE